MSVVELPPPATTPLAHPDRVAERPRGLVLTLEQAVYLGLFALALLAHLWGLGDRALHHDETLHAAFSWHLFRGEGFVHDPLLHGPFLYFFTALTYLLFGDSDYTARLGVALFGSVLVVLPYLIRREIGRGAALLAAVYLLISPAFLYVGRFIRHDMFAVTFEMLTFVGIVRYASTRRARWLYLAAAALGLMFTTIETFFLYSAIFGSLLVLVFLWRIWRPGLIIGLALGLAVVALVFVLPGKAQRPAGPESIMRARGEGYTCPSSSQFPPDNPILFTPGLIPGLGPLETADNDYALCVRQQADNNFGAYFVKLWQFFRHPSILLSAALSVAALAGLYVLIWRRRDRDGETPWERARARGDGIVEAFASLGWGWRALIALAIFGSIYTLFFTAFFTNPVGIISGTTGSLLYWLAQHGQERGSQPRYYYLVLLSIYEPLVLLWSTVGLFMTGVMVVRRLRRGQKTTPDKLDTPPDEWLGRDTGATPHAAIDWSFAMPILLAWWTIATLFLYSWAGEKMPWLTIHVALPPTLLGAWALARTLAWSRGSVAPDTTDGNTAEPEASNGDHPAWNTPISIGAMAQQARPLLIYLGIFGLIATFCFVLLTIFAKPDGPQVTFATLLPVAALILIGLLTLGAGLLRGARWAIGALAIGIALVGGLYSIRSAYQLNYRWGDVPREMLIYTQTSPDVARVINSLEQASIRRGGAMDMPIWYDNETVWDWYMRRFTQASEQPQALAGPPGEDVMAVLMLQENIDTYPQNLQNLQGFRIQRYPLRWWFPEETYRLPPDWTSAPLNEGSPLLMRLLRNPLDGHASAELWQYLMYRKTPTPLGSSDFILAIRPVLADEMGLGTGTEQK